MKLEEFVRESNAIEGIHREPTVDEISMHQWFLRQKAITVMDMEHFVDVVAGAVLRNKEGLNVRGGCHTPPPGCEQIEWELERLLKQANQQSQHPYETHNRYKTLHPFTDGNGRSGRMLWLWQMERFHGGAPLGFLHTWYYQSLQDSRSAG